MPHASTKPATKKVAAKKTAAVGRRRKFATPELESQVGENAAATGPETGEQINTTNDAALKDLFLDMLGMPQKPSPDEQLKNIAVIDLRGVNFFGRFQTVALLQNAGYSFSNNIQTPMTDAVHYYQHTEVFLLNHHNKLVTPNSWDAGKNSDAISRVEAAYAVPDVAFSAPVPEFVEVCGELFARVK